MRRGETWYDPVTKKSHTVNWWTEGQYWPWNPWYTSYHMIWAVPMVIFFGGTLMSALFSGLPQ